MNWLEVDSVIIHKKKTFIFKQFLFKKTFAYISRLQYVYTRFSCKTYINV